MAIRIVNFADGFTSETSPSTGGSMVDPMTTIGDIIIRNGSNNTVRLAAGSSGQVLTISGGVPAWAATTGANTALSNLASVAINTSLVSDTNNTDDLGTDAIEWKDLWVHSIKHNDASTPTLTITTTANNGDISLTPHGTGQVKINDADLEIRSGTSANELRLFEPSGSGTNYTAFKAQAQAGNITFTLPAADGSSGQVLSSNGSGTLSWVTRVTGPGSAVSGNIATFNGTSGATIQDSGANISSGILTVTGGFKLPDGTYANPSLYFTADEDVGLFRYTTNTLGIAAGSVSPYVTAFSDTAITMQRPLRLDQSALISFPALNFNADGNTGLHYVSEDSFAIVTNGVARATVANDNMKFAQDVWVQDGYQLRFYEPSASGTNYTAFKAQAQAGNVTYTLPAADGSSGQVLSTNASGTLSWIANGTGDVVGPGSSTDNAIARFDGTTGKLLQNSGASVTDDGYIYAAVSSNVAAPSFAFATDTDTGIMQVAGSPNTMSFTVGGTRVVDITTTKLQVVSTDGQILAQNGTSTAPSLSFVNGPTSGFSRPSAGTIDFIATGNNMARLTTSAFSILDGYDFRIYEPAASGSNYSAFKSQAMASNITYTLPASDTASGALVSNGSGSLTWSLLTNSNIAASGSANIALNKLAASTADRVPLFDGSGYLTPSSVTNTELGYLSGVTSAIQTQFTNKLSLSGGTMTGTITLANRMGVRFSELTANGSSYIHVTAPEALDGILVLQLPANDGAAGKVLATDGAGVTSWETRADAALSNLASVAINTSLISDTDNTDDLGSSAKVWANTYTRNLKLDGSTSGMLTLTGAATITDHTLTLPAAQGGVNTFLKNDGSGNLSWAAGGGGTDLTGLGVNNRIARWDGTDTLQSSGITLDDGNNLSGIGTISSGAITSSSDLTLTNSGTASELRLSEPSAGGSSYAGFKAPALAGNTIYTLPTAFPGGNTILQSDSSGVLSWIAAGAGDITNGGNTTGAALVIGTNDNFDLQLERNNATRVTVTDTFLELNSGTTAMGLKFLEPSGSGTNYTAFKAQAQAGDITYTLPAADAAVSGHVLSSNGSGTLSWTAGPGATPALSNLASVAINTSLISDTDNTDNLGSNAIAWANTYTAAAIIGQQDATASPVAGILRGPNKTGTNAAGVDLVIAPGNGTGQGGSGALLFKVGVVHGSDAVADTLETRLKIDAGQEIQVIDTALSLTNTGTARALRFYEPSASGVNYFAFKAVAMAGPDVTLDLPNTAPSAGQYLKASSSTALTWDTPAGTGDVTAASTFGTDNRIIRSDGTGKGVQSSGITLDDSNNLSGIGTVSSGSITTSGIVQASDGSASAPSFAFTNDLDGGMFRAGSNMTGFAAGGTEWLRLDSANTAGKAVVQVGPGNNTSTYSSYKSFYRQENVPVSGADVGMMVMTNTTSSTPTSQVTLNGLFTANDSAGRANAMAYNVGIFGEAFQSNANAITDLHGLYYASYVQGAGTVTRASGLNVAVNVNAGTRTVTDLSIIYARNGGLAHTGGTVTNYRGLYLETPTGAGGGAITNIWPLYENWGSYSTNSKNYFTSPLLQVETGSAPTNPTDGTQVQTYMKGDKYIIAYNHGGTMKYRYLDLTSTDATWTYTTSAP